MHLMTARTEFRGLLTMERLQENLAVRLRIDVGELVVHETQHWMIAGREIVKRRVLDLEVPLTHRASHVRDRVAGGAREPCLRLGRVDLLLDWPIEAAIEEDGVVVTARAPLRRLRANRILHVLDRLAIP